MRNLRTASIVILSAAVAFTLLSGNLLHALVPHEHGPNGTETVVWGTLHASLHHEDKIVPLLPSILIAVFIAAKLLRSPVRRHPLWEHDRLLEFLRRGIAPYRKFG